MTPYGQTTEQQCADDDATADYLREHYPEFAAAGAIPAGAYGPEEDEQP